MTNQQPEPNELDDLRQQLAGYRYAIEGLRTALTPLLPGTPLASNEEAMAADPLNVIDAAMLYLQGHRAGLEAIITAAALEIQRSRETAYLAAELRRMAIEEQARQIAGLKAQLASLTGERPREDSHIETG